MRKDALPDPRLGWQVSAVDKLRAELPLVMEPRAGMHDPDQAKSHLLVHGIIDARSSA
jgi:hypothetical protein